MPRGNWHVQNITPKIRPFGQKKGHCGRWTWFWSSVWQLVDTEEIYLFAEAAVSYAEFETNLLIAPSAQSDVKC